MNCLYPAILHSVCVSTARNRHTNFNFLLHLLETGLSVPNIRVYVSCHEWLGERYFLAAILAKSEASCCFLLCPSVGFASCAQGPVNEAVQAHWADTFKATVHQKRFLLALTSARRMNNLCILSVHLRPIRIWVAPQILFLAQEHKSWIVQLKRKSLNNLSLLKDLACCSKHTTHWQNPAQTEACQLAVWRRLTSLWVDRPSSGSLCALHKEFGSIKSLVWWNSWGWSKNCGSRPKFLGLFGNMISNVMRKSFCSKSAIWWQMNLHEVFQDVSFIFWKASSVLKGW